MARVTVEDCLANVSNRFGLVRLASKRARQIAREGSTPLVPLDNDKPTVLALREIAEGLCDESLLDAQKPVVAKPIAKIIPLEKVLEAVDENDDEDLEDELVFETEEDAAADAEADDKDE